jgi:Uma2 family endonuclease
MVCGNADVDDKMTLSNPRVLVEVLSKTTEGYDRGEKLEHYHRMPSLQDVFLVATTEQRVDHHHRLAEGQWLLTTYQEGAVVVPVPDGAGQFELPLTEIYERIDFAQTES